MFICYNGIKKKALRAVVLKGDVLWTSRTMPGVSMLPSFIRSHRCAAGIAGGGRSSGDGGRRVRRARRDGRLPRRMLRPITPCGAPGLGDQLARVDSQCRSYAANLHERRVGRAALDLVERRKATARDARELSQGHAGGRSRRCHGSAQSAFEALDVVSLSVELNHATRLAATSVIVLSDRTTHSVQ